MCNSIRRSAGYRHGLDQAETPLVERTTHYNAHNSLIEVSGQDCEVGDTRYAGGRDYGINILQYVYAATT